MAWVMPRPSWPETGAPLFKPLACVAFVFLLLSRSLVATPLRGSVAGLEVDFRTRIYDRPITFADATQTQNSVISRARYEVLTITQFGHLRLGRRLWMRTAIPYLYANVSGLRNVAGQIVDASGTVRDLQPITLEPRLLVGGGGDSARETVLGMRLTVPARNTHDPFEQIAHNILTEGSIGLIDPLYQNLFASGIDWKFDYMWKYRPHRRATLAVQAGAVLRGPYEPVQDIPTRYDPGESADVLGQFEWRPHRRLQMTVGLSAAVHGSGSVKNPRRDTGLPSTPGQPFIGAPVRDLRHDPDFGVHWTVQHRLHRRETQIFGAHVGIPGTEDIMATDGGILRDVQRGVAAGLSWGSAFRMTRWTGASLGLDYDFIGPVRIGGRSVFNPERHIAMIYLGSALYPPSGIYSAVNLGIGVTADAPTLTARWAWSSRF